MKKLLLVMSSVLVIAACTTTNNVSSYNRQSQVPSSVSTSELREAIIASGKERGWTLKNINSNTIQGTIVQKGGITATTDVTYGPGQYKFKLIKSSGLSQKGDVIHRRYNNWINFWDNGIQNRINN